MANKTLTAKVKFETKSAEASLKRLAKKVNDVQNAINKASKNNTRFTTQINKATAAQNKLNTATNKVAKTTQKVVDANQKAVSSAKALSSSYRSAKSSANGLLTTVKRLASTYLGVMGMRAIVTTSDTITSTQNKLNALNGGDTALTQNQMDKMYVSSNNARMNYTDMLANASKSMTLAGSSFQGNMDNAIRFQEIMAKTYALGGASAPEMSNSMYQLIQALGSGVLAGDELRAVREGAPLAYQEIEKFAQGVFNSTESLKDMASQGKITSDVVVAAIMGAGEDIDKRFEETAWTFGAVWNRIKSAAVKAFEPISNQLSNMLNKVAESGIFEKLEVVFWNLSKILQITFQVIYNVISAIADAINWVVENWDWLSRVILTVLSVIAIAMAVILFPKLIAWLHYIVLAAVYYLWLGVTALASALKVAAAWAIANWQMLLIIAIIAAIVVAVIWLSDSFEDACGMIVGVLMGAVSVIWNLIVTLVTAILKNALLPLATAWDNFANFFGNLFNDPIAAIIRCFESLADSVLSILETIAKGIDAVFGSNLASAVQGWRNGLSSRADELVDRYGNGTYEEKSDAASKIESILDNVQDVLLWDTSDAYSTGYDWGYDAGSWLSDKFSGFGESLSLDSIGDKLGIDFGNGFPNPSDSAFDAGGAYQSPDPNKLLGNIADDTGSIADSMELSKEDLDYLRKIAEMEWKKEFTTASIKIDMSNYNTVNGESDLDGIVTKLTDKLYEELNVVANGVYV